MLGRTPGSSVQSGLVSVSDRVVGLFAAFCSESRPNVVLVARGASAWLALSFVCQVSIGSLEHITLDYGIQGENLYSSAEALDFSTHLDLRGLKEFLVTTICRR